MNYDDNIDGQISEADKEFVQSAADGSMFEIKAGEMAEMKGSTTFLGKYDGCGLVECENFR